MNTNSITCFPVAPSDRKPERGAASLHIELSGGFVTLRHGSTGSILKAKFPVSEGYWERLFDAASTDVSAP